MRLHWVVAIASALSWCFVAASQADEASQRAYSKGLAELHSSGASDSSRAQFEAAVEADPEDAFARYYLASAMAQAGESGAAIEQLREALRLRPGFAEAAADLGVLLVRTDRPSEAIPWLELASERVDLRGRATLMLGVARLRLGELDAAIEKLRAAAVLEPAVELEARFYEGVAESRKGRVDAARGHFEWVVARSPKSPFAVEAQRFLSQGGELRERPWVVYASLGVEYDTNVTLETDQQKDRDDLTLPDKDDTSFSIRVGGRYRLWGNEDTSLTFGYEFFQRLYVDLNEYNLQGHRPGFRLTHRWRDFRFGFAVDYDYFLIEEFSYLQRVTGIPWAAFQEGDWGRSELSYRVRWNGFYRTPPGGGALIDPDDEVPGDVLDSVSHRPILRQYFYIDGPARYVSLAYLFEYRDPVGNGESQFEFISNGVEVGVGWLLPWRISSHATYTYRYEDYSENGRLDQPHEIVVGLRRPITRNLSVSAAYQGTIHDSNQFEYDRHIVSTAFEFVF